MFLSLDPGISAWCIDKSNDGKAELFGHFHNPECLPVPLWIWLAEVAGNPLPGRTPLLVSDECNRTVSVKSQPCNDGRVIARTAVAVNLHEVLCECLQIIQGIGPLGMAGDLNDLEGS